MTTIHDCTAGMPPALAAHVREIAAESGLDHVSYHSYEEKTTLPDGREVESWYDEDASSALMGWGAFIKGVGSRHEASREEAIAEVMKAAGL